MTEINLVEEFDRDWDWFAICTNSMIGHFTTAGIRALPKSVRRDRKSTLRLIKYFFEEAPHTGSYIVHPDLEKKLGGWRGESDRNRYLRSFLKTASTGLFSYDTQTSGSNTDYFLVAIPQNPLRINDLPPEIHNLLVRTQSTYAFDRTADIASADTTDW
jgi:hypothetical protein